MTAPTGCSISKIEVTTAGRRGSEMEINSQPSTCDDMASTTSQACDSRPGTQSMSPTATPPSAETKAAVSVASKSGPPGRRRSELPWRRIKMKRA